MALYLSAPVVNGIFSQWFSNAEVRTGSAVPFLSENPAHEGAAIDQAPLPFMLPAGPPFSLLTFFSAG
jgi:hypothetical protein